MYMLCGPGGSEEGGTDVEVACRHLNLGCIPSVSPPAPPPPTSPPASTPPLNLGPPSQASAIRAKLNKLKKTMPQQDGFMISNMVMMFESLNTIQGETFIKVDTEILGAVAEAREAANPNPGPHPNPKSSNPDPNPNPNPNVQP
jgi:hypothetical protein